MRRLPQTWVDELDECERAYLSREGPLKQSGWNGTYESWKEKRGPILQAVDSDGDFIDIGCANGYLLECLAEWGKGEKGITLIPTASITVRVSSNWLAPDYPDLQITSTQGTCGTGNRQENTGMSALA